MNYTLPQATSTSNTHVTKKLEPIRKREIALPVAG